AAGPARPDPDPSPVPRGGPGAPRGPGAEVRVFLLPRAGRGHAGLPRAGGGRGGRGRWRRPGALRVLWAELRFLGGRHRGTVLPASVGAHARPGTNAVTRPESRSEGRTDAENDC